MDLSQAAFGLDMREASRIYFISPILNPQVKAQAIGRLRRISQKKPVLVETLVLKDSIDEVILERNEHMSQAEHLRTKSILDIPTIYNWIKNAKINPLPEGCDDDLSRMSPLAQKHHVFGRGFGRTVHPDDGLIPERPKSQRRNSEAQPSNEKHIKDETRGVKRPREENSTDKPRLVLKFHSSVQMSNLPPSGEVRG